MVGATIVEFYKGLLDGERLIIKTILYIRVALTSERLVSRFFHFKLSFTSTSTHLMPVWYDKPVNHIIEETTATQTLEFQGSSGTGRLQLVKGAGYLRNGLKDFQTDLPISS